MGGGSRERRSLKRPQKILLIDGNDVVLVAFGQASSGCYGARWLISCKLIFWSRGRRGRRAISS